MPEPTPEMPGAGYDPEIIEVNSGADFFRALADLVSRARDATDDEERDEYLSALTFAVDMALLSNLARMPFMVYDPPKS